MPAEEWFTLPQIAEMLNVDPSTVRYWVSSGRLPAEKRGRRWIAERLDVEAITAQRRRRGQSTSVELTPEPSPELTSEPSDGRKGLNMIDSIDFSSSR